MNVQLQKMLDICKLLLVFTTLTLFFYGMIVWVVEKIEPPHRYNQPKGKAVKVLQFENLPVMKNMDDFKNRLLFYYWFGE